MRGGGAHVSPRIDYCVGADPHQGAEHPLAESLAVHGATPRDRSLAIVCGKLATLGEFTKNPAEAAQRCVVVRHSPHRIEGSSKSRGNDYQRTPQLAGGPLQF